MKNKSWKVYSNLKYIFEMFFLKFHIPFIYVHIYLLLTQIL